jgi:hypothetical protein
LIRISIFFFNEGLPATSILKEVSSFDTIGNGYFSATIHALPQRWKAIAVITSEFHMPRSKVGEHIFNEYVMIFYLPAYKNGCREL